MFSHRSNCVFPTAVAQKEKKKAQSLSSTFYSHYCQLYTSLWEQKKSSYTPAAALPLNFAEVAVISDAEGGSDIKRA